MSDESIPTFSASLYARPCIGGARITRTDEKSLGPFLLDREAAWSLGTNNFGVFVGNSRPLDSTIYKLIRLEDNSPEVPTWVIIAASTKMAAVFVQRWFLPEGAKPVALTRLKLPRTRSNILVCTPETLRLVPDHAKSNIAGLILVDMLCHVHKARRGNDRPQLVANFRNSLSLGRWSPPLFILTEKPAKSVDHDIVARAYCLEALWFLEGRTVFFYDDEEVTVQ